MGKGKTKKREKRNLIEWSCDYIRCHWIQVAVVRVLTTFWFSFFVTRLGIWMRLVKTNEEGMAEGLSVVGWISTVIIIILSLWITISESYSKRTNHDENKEKQLIADRYLYKTILDKTNEICSQKVGILKSYILRRSNANENIPDIISKPEEQLELLMKELKNYQYEVLKNTDTNISYNDMTISMLYRFKNGGNIGEWQEIICNSEGSLSLMQYTNSTFNFLITNNKKSILINDKQKADLEMYLINRRDKECIDKGLPAGSIYCNRIQIYAGDEEIIEAIIGMSLYGRKFVNDNDKDSTDKCKRNLDIIMDSFVVRCKIELEYLYLSYLKSLH